MYSDKARMNRLWANTGNSTFPAQTISVDWSTERFLFICFRTIYNNNNYLCSIVPCGNNQGIIESHLNVALADTAVFVVRRLFTLGSTGITFTSATSHNVGSDAIQTDNTRLVPYFIWGIK